MRRIQNIVTNTIDRLDLHATAPSLLLELQDRLGQLSAEALRLTANGRRPFRPDPGWERALGDLMFTMISIADQTGVNLENAVEMAIVDLENRLKTPTNQRRDPEPSTKSWPLSYED